jgi:general secretion pathway protein N
MVRHRSPTPTAALGLRPRRWALAGACAGGLLAAVAFAPAHWLAGYLSRASEGRVQLIEARGTVWTGSSRLVLTGGSGSVDRTALPGHVDWQLRPSLRGLDLQLAAPCCTRDRPWQLTLRMGWNGPSLALADQRSVWPAALLSGLGTPWNTVGAEGRLQLRTQGLRLARIGSAWQLDGQLELDAQGISSRLSTLRPMGSYRLTLAGGPGSTLTLTTLEGALQMQGSGQWVGGRLRFQGVATAAPPHEAALANLLNILGRRDGARSLISVG